MATQTSCTCTDCGGSFSLDSSALSEALKTEAIVIRTSENPGWSYSQYFGVCRACQAIFKAASRPKWKRNVDEEHKYLMQLVNQTRQAHPDWSLKKCVHEAVVFVNSAPEEHDPAFRAYLLEKDES